MILSIELFCGNAVLTLTDLLRYLDVYYLLTPIIIIFTVLQSLHLYAEIKTTAEIMKSYLIVLFVLLSGLSSGQLPVVSDYQRHCVNDEERKLYNLIMGYRNENKLPAIEFSTSLSYVARVHAIDLTQHRPDFGGCNPHSWSDKGKWKPCCYAQDENRIACMNQKPKELTGYKFKAWEVVYYGGETATADDAYGLWRDIALMNDYLLNTGKWTKQWASIGVGIYGEYACVWFGEGADQVSSAINCSDTIVYDTIKDLNTRFAGVDEKSLFYVITSLANNKEQAEIEVQKLVNKGFKNAVYLSNTSFFRIAADRFINETDAYRELEKIKKQYPQAWLLKPKIIK